MRGLSETKKSFSPTDIHFVPTIPFRGCMFLALFVGKFGLNHFIGEFVC